jgi:hypothetical protein
MWLMNGTWVTSAFGVGNLPADWTIVGTGDFNGDGMGDILFHNSNGGVVLWLMNGATITSGLGVGSMPSNWQIVGTSDF